MEISSINVNGVEYPINDLQKNNNALFIALMIAFGKAKEVISEDSSYKLAITDSENNVLACKLYNDSWEFSGNIDSILDTLIDNIDFSSHNNTRNNVALLMSLAFKSGTASIKDTHSKFIITDAKNNILCSKSEDNEWQFAMDIEELISYLIDNIEAS